MTQSSPIRLALVPIITNSILKKIGNKVDKIVYQEIDKNVSETLLKSKELIFQIHTKKNDSSIPESFLSIFGRYWANLKIKPIPTLLPFPFLILFILFRNINYFYEFTPGKLAGFS
jgi:hypothetical protein